MISYQVNNYLSDISPWKPPEFCNQIIIFNDSSNHIKNRRVGKQFIVPYNEFCIMRYHFKNVCGIAEL